MSCAACSPDLEIDWLAQDPVTRVLEGEGERIHPASVHLANESRHIESESAEHDLHCFHALRRMDEILAANFMVFHDVAREQRYDLWIGDEAWELDYYLHENPREKRVPFAWLTDFVGFLPMDERDERERFLTADYNAEMVEHVAHHPHVRDLALFVGNPEDIVPRRLGPELPMIRDWTERNFDFTGYVTGFDPAELADRDALRAELGYGDDERVCIVTVGGSGVGADLLRRVIAAFPQAQEAVPEPAHDRRRRAAHRPGVAARRTTGLEVVPYVHNLYRHLAACDLAVVQGGLTTAMELTANRRPFLYFPLRHHFEQNFHVRHRLERYGAGRRMDFDDVAARAIAEAIAEEIGRDGGLPRRRDRRRGACRAKPRAAAVARPGRYRRTEPWRARDGRSVEPSTSRRRRDGDHRERRDDRRRRGDHGAYEAVERQRAAFLADPYPSLEERQELLGALAAMLMGHRTRDPGGAEQRLRRAPAARHRPDRSARPGRPRRVRGRAARAAGWRSEPRAVDPALYGSGRAFVQPQPKGVIGNIVPWNFPFDLSVGPLVEMLAAGNRVVIKPSEYTPACAELLREMVHATFDRDRVDVVVGGLELARAFTRVRWDHLLYTGSPAIGREIAKAAAEQLVPVTLELGGKCPAILAEDSVDAESVKQVLGDEGDQERPDVHLGRLLPRAARRSSRSSPSSPPRTRASRCPATASSDELHRHHLRAPPGADRRRCSTDARARGCDVRPLEDGARRGPRRARQLPISLVIDPPDDLALMREEIFGPILPVKAYDTLDEAIDYVNAGERPLALYVFAKDEARRRRRAAPHDLGRRLRELRRGPRRAALAAVRRRSARAARAAITGSRGSASSPTCAPCSSAARAT